MGNWLSAANIQAKLSWHPRMQRAPSPGLTDHLHKRGLKIESFYGQFGKWEQPMKQADNIHISVKGQGNENV